MLRTGFRSFVTNELNDGIRGVEPRPSVATLARLLADFRAACCADSRTA